MNIQRVSSWSFKLDEDIILYENNQYTRNSINWYDYFSRSTPNKVASSNGTIGVKAEINLGGRIIERRKELKLRARNRTIKQIDEDNKKVYFDYTPEDYWIPLQKFMKSITKNFYLTEYELLDEIKKYLDGGYEYVHFRPQVEIGGCIADGLAFVKPDKRYEDFEILAFEVKTDKDNYSRLAGQMNAYINIADKIYLVIEGKEIPDGLPFFAGVIMVDKEDGVKLKRSAINLRHEYAESELWKKMMQVTNKKLEIDRGSIQEIFDLSRSIKKKLIWNQFVIGFKQSYHKDYIQFSEKEKRLVSSYFASCGVPTLNKFFEVES